MTARHHRPTAGHDHATLAEKKIGRNSDIDGERQVMGSVGRLGARGGADRARPVHQSGSGDYGQRALPSLWADSAAVPPCTSAAETPSDVFQR